jgi:DNA-binding response OmpR family regulator
MLTALSRETFDVVLLDWNMPEATGLEILQRSLQKLEDPPTFILLTSRSDKDDVVRGLEAGASDYIVKPESSEVIRARIEAAARKAGRGQAKRFGEFGPYKVDYLQKSIELNGESIKLTSKEFQLAVLFFENINRPLSRGYIFSQVWSSANDLETRTLDMHMSRVRSKLALRPENGFVIQTVFGFGYRMDTYQDVE